MHGISHGILADAPIEAGRTATYETRFLKDYPAHAAAIGDEARYKTLLSDSLSYGAKQERQYLKPHIYTEPIRKTVENKVQEAVTLEQDHDNLVVNDFGRNALYDSYKDAHVAYRDQLRLNRTTGKTANDTQALKTADEKHKKALDAAVKKQPDDEVQAKLGALDKWQKAADEANEARNVPTPSEFVEQAQATAAEAQQKLADGIGPTLDALKGSLSGAGDLSGPNFEALKAKIDEIKPEAGAKASEEDKKAAKKEGRNQVLLWGGIGGGAVIIGLVVGLLIMANKMSHQKAQLHQAISLLMQSAQNSSPDQSQGGPPSPYAASQNGFGGYGQQQYAQASR
jgi:hypothetical protein